MVTNSIKERAEQAYIRCLDSVSNTGIKGPGVLSCDRNIWLVKAGTHPNQQMDYVCCRLSQDGPIEEFRIYKNGDVQFWFLDWFEGFCINVTDNAADIISSIIKSVFPDFI